MELMPCQFCGSKAKLHEDNYHMYRWIECERNPTVDGIVYCVSGPTFKIAGPGMEDSEKRSAAREQAGAVWNRIQGWISKGKLLEEESVQRSGLASRRL